MERPVSKEHPMEILSVYHSFPSQAACGYQKVAEVHVDPTSTRTSLVILDERCRAVLERLGRGIVPQPGAPVVALEDSDTFFDVLCSLFRHSSYWRVVRESATPLG